MPGARVKNDMAAHISGKALDLSRDTLLLNMRFLHRALVQCVPAASPRITRGFASDGHFIYFDPWHVLKEYKISREMLNRAYLHVVMHCLFRHLFFDKKIDGVIWNLACDIAVEGLIDRIDSPCTAISENASRSGLLAKLRKDVGELTAERLYSYFLLQDRGNEHYHALRESFYADDHSLWYQEARGGDDSGGGNREGGDGMGISASASAGVGAGAADEEAGLPPEPEAGAYAGNQNAGDGGGAELRDGNDNDIDEGDFNEGDSDEGDFDIPAKDELEKIWKKIGEKIESESETKSGMWGSGAGDLFHELKAINREQYDYGAFLRRFATLGENMEINDDEFDYIFYTYGFRLFKNMPLVEPLEYREVKKIRDIVIALDTSQSVEGDLVQHFVTKTWNMLKQEQNFFTKFNLHIIQSGASVLQDAVLTSQDEFDDYISGMTLHGFGGTDFRPVFTYVDELIRQHRFTNLKGLIYFTDGYGDFPPSPGEYDTAFVFVESGRETPDVPPWAIKLVLSPSEIRAI